MRKNVRKHSPFQRLMAFALAFVMVLGYVPAAASADTTVVPGTVTTVSDPDTLTRPEEIYGNDTENAGKVTVGKSVSDDTTSIEYDAGKTQPFTPAENNFIVTISQSAQVMGLSTEMAVPIDAVFVLDTSGSMDNDDRAENLVTAANSAISALMAANENNRVAVVAFSSGGYGDGAGGNDNNANEFPATTQLSPLAHYTGAAATSHLQWVNSNGGTGTWPGQQQNRRYIAGRNAQGNIGGYRHGYEGGTNIQAGIAEGAKILTAANPTLTYADGTTVTRMPVLIVISDGQPTFSCESEAWYNPTIPDERNQENGPGSDAYEGNGFLAALTAAYYKGAITDHYYGANASEDNRCSVYTVGVDIEALDDYENNWGQTVSYVDDNQALAETTLDPVAAIAGTANSTYYTYGNSWNANNPATTHGFKTYWDNYVAGSRFTIRTDNNETFTVTANSIANSKNYVMGNSSTGTAMYAGGLGYNDDYYSASSGDLNDVFTSLVTEISKKAMSSPTHVTSGGDHNFEGYVTFTDPIGEYMEVKDMKGVLANGNFYQGTRFTALLKSGTDADFNAMLREVLQARMSMTESQVADLDAFIEAARNDALNDPDADNSITWWGREYRSGEEDTGVSVLAHATDDSIEYIEESRANGTIPEGADYVCRSYFFYGTAGGTVANPNHQYMYFMVRVQRSLTAPYQQTVVISAPASLLSVDEVFITESTDEDGNKVYTAEVTDVYPARVIYEVGLRSDINAQNVASIVSADYANETVNGEGSVNYDPTTDTYTFFTNDWDRSQSLGSHARAMTKATFDAAADNAFYTYQEDTLLLNADGTPYTGEIPLGQTLYYAREVYTWDNPNTDGTYPAVKSTVLIPVTVPDSIPAGSTAIKQEDGQWYISKGVYTASTLQVTGDDTVKEANNTGTSAIVAHPYRTGDSTNSHYTVLLGNNGKLSLVAEPSKTVDITDASGVIIENANGDPVMVGDTLTYKIKVTNPDEEKASTATITDSVPAGTAFVSGSAGIIRGETTEYLTIAPVDGVLTWENISLAAGETVYATFQVTVTEDALSGAQDVEKIENTATVKIGNNPAYTTNTTENPPEGKKVVDSSGNEFAEDAELKVGDVLVYRVRAYNDAVDSNGVPTTATLTITDKIPDGTTYVAGSADHGGIYDEATRTITWTIADMAADTSVVVSFRVAVDASAETVLENSADIKIGSNDPRTTNEVTSTVGKGDLSITKAFAEGTDGFADKTFKLILSESTGKLNGTYVLDSSVDGRDGTVTFVNGISTTDVTITKNETITIKDLPLGTVISVSEDVSDMPGWTPSYSAATLIAGDAALSSGTITNRYDTVPVTFQLKGTKNVEGANFPDGTFTFHATLTDENGDVITGENARQVTATAVVTGGQSAVFEFSARSFDKEGTFYYLIEEVPSTLPGVTSATNQYLVKLVISDVNSQLVATTYVQSRTRNADGTYPAWAAFTDAMEYAWKDNTDTLTFTNSYTPADAVFTISGTKTLTGRDLAANEFSFQLIYGQDAIATANNAGDGSFSFPAITVTAADMEGAQSKTFTYYIREVVGSLANVDYDRSYYQVDITIEDNNGQLRETNRVITKYLIKDDGTYDVENATEVPAVEYLNEYNTQDVQVQLSGTKTLTGGTLAADDFTFQVVEATVAGDVWTATERIVASAGNAADGSITFSPINYTRAMFAEGETEKTFYYIVKEIIPYGEPSFDVNMKYDTTEYRVTVKVTLDTASGQLDAQILSVDSTAVNADSYGDLDFTNIQNPATVTYRPVGNKRVQGENLPDNLRFSFRITSLDGTSVEGTGLSAPTNNSAEGVDITFSALEYDHTDVGNTYFYLIEEATVNMSDGVQYSTAQYILAVTVGRNANNALTVTPVYYSLGDAAIADLIAAEKESADAVIALLGSPVDTISFTNVYEAERSLNITADKNLSGRALDEEGNEFEFRLQLLQKNPDGTYSLNPNTSIVNGTNLNDGTVTFGTLNFTDTQIAGDAFLLSYTTDETSGVITKVHQFNALISEIEPESAKLSGVTYDPAKYIVSIHWVETITPVEGAGSQYDYGQPFVAAVYAAAENAGVYTVNGNALAENLHPAAGSTTVSLGDYVTFTNEYKVSTGTSVTLTAAKTLEGRALANDEFTFELFRVYKDANDQLHQVLVETATNKNSNGTSGTVSFTRNYPATIDIDAYFVDTDADGVKDTATFIYRMVEENTGMGGVDYTEEDYWIEVVIFHDEANAKLVRQSVKYYHTFDTETMTFPEKAPVNGQETDNLIVSYGADAESTPGTAAVVFANTYKTNDTAYTPVASKNLQIKKDGQWTAAETLTPGAFSFRVVVTDENGTITKIPASEGSQNEIYPVVSTGNNTADGSVVFTPIGYTKAGTYYYVIQEIKGTDPTIEYNPTNTVYYLKVVVVDDGEGVLTVLSTQYGIGLENGEFTEIVYSETFAELVTEGEETSVVVKDPVVTSGTVAEITNHYGPGYVSIDLGVKKTVEIENPGTENQVYELKGSEFDFDVYEYVDGEQGDYVTSGTNGATNADGIAPITFGSIVITRADVYDGEVSTTPASKEFTYIVREAPASDAEDKGITIDGEPIIVTVTVTDDGYGNLTYTVSHSGGDGEKSDTFVNNYSADPATAELAAHKNLINKKLTENEFKFELSNGDVTIDNIGHDAQGNLLIPADALTFTAPGEYIFTLRESIPEDANAEVGAPTYGYDDTVYTIKITVTDNGKGQLIAVPSYYKTNAEDELESVAAATFTNSYTPGPITADLDVSIDADKQITDKDGNILTGEGMLAGFEFVVTDIHGEEVTTGVSDENGNIDFGSFTFSQAGEYHYYISEVVDVKPGYTEDARQWAVHVLVRYNESNDDLVIVNEAGEEEKVEIGQLYIQQSDVTIHLVVPASQETAEPAPLAEIHPVFVNVYDPEPAHLTLAAAKILTGRDLRNGEFTFHLVQKDSDGAYTIMAGSATNDADGRVVFYLDFDENDMMEAGEYVTQKTFHYQVHEHVPEDAVDGVKDGVTYAANTAELEVVVRDVDGELKAYINGIEAGVASAGTFTNTYTAPDAEVVLKAEKVLSGMDLVAGAFEFELVDSQGKVVQTVKNAADGSVTFEKLVYTHEMLEKALSKDYVYTIREKAGSVEGMTYDETVYTATVSVTDDQKGNLSAVVIYSTSAGVATPVFRNDYEPPVVDEDDPDPIVAVITAEKTLTGKPLTANAFTFELVDADNKAVSATNDSTGKISFSVQYTKAGTYVYTMREKIGTEAGMSYDTNTYKVTVTVTESEDGILSASVAYGTADGKAPVFKNSYTPVPVTVTLEGKKVLKGRAMKEGEFKFQVKDSTGALVATGTNDAKGNIVFTAIALPSAGKYVLTVTEVNSRAWFMTYDNSKFTVTVDVTEKDGVLNASVTYPKDGIKFVNTYKYNSSATPGTGDTTPLPLMITLMVLSAAALVVILLLAVRKKKHGKRDDR